MDAGYPLKRIAVYMRVSTVEQKRRETIITQRAAAEKYIAANDLAVYGYYADDGVSGTLALEQRPDGARLLRDARDGKHQSHDTCSGTPYRRLGTCVRRRMKPETGRRDRSLSARHVDFHTIRGSSRAGRSSRPR